MAHQKVMDKKRLGLRNLSARWHYTLIFSDDEEAEVVKEEKEALHMYTI